MDDEQMPRTGLLVQITRLTEQLSALSNDIRELRHDFREWKEESKSEVASLRAEVDRKLSDYVTKDAFDPVRLLAFGATATLLVSLLGAIVAMVIK